MALTEFFHANALASVHLLRVSWYLTSSLCMYLCSWMHIITMLWSMVDVVSSGSCPILLKVLTLNFAFCIVRLHFSNFCLSSVADFSNTEARAPTSARCATFLPMRRAMRFGCGSGQSFDGFFYSHLQKLPFRYKPTINALPEHSSMKLRWSAIRINQPQWK